MGLFRKQVIPEVQSFKATVYTCRACPGIGTLTEEEMVKHTRIIPAHATLISAENQTQNIVTNRVEKSAISNLSGATQKFAKWLNNPDDQPAKRKKR